MEKTYSSDETIQQQDPQDETTQQRLNNLRNSYRPLNKFIMTILYNEGQICGLSKVQMMTGAYLPDLMASIKKLKDSKYIEDILIDSILYLRATQLGKERLNKSNKR